MGQWFDIEKIDNTTFAISEYGHWEKVHSYLLIGKTSALLIDTGLGIGNIKKEIDKLTSLPIKVVTTHVHWDHIGGHSLFSDISVHKGDEGWIRNGIPIPLEMVKKNISKDSFSKIPPKEFNIDKYNVYTGEGYKILNDNDIIDIGLRKIRVIHTPGHSPGHICLCEEGRGYLYTGDLVYKGTLCAFYPSTDPIQFKKSIDRISELKGITRILPAHYDLNIDLDLLSSIRNAFNYIEDKSMLKQGCGVFEFDHFSIHI